MPVDVRGPALAVHGEPRLERQSAAPLNLQLVCESRELIPGVRLASLEILRASLSLAGLFFELGELGVGGISVAHRGAEIDRRSRRQGGRLGEFPLRRAELRAGLLLASLRARRSLRRLLPRGVQLGSQGVHLSELGASRGGSLVRRGSLLGDPASLCSSLGHFPPGLLELLREGLEPVVSLDAVGDGGVAVGGCFFDVGGELLELVLRREEGRLAVPELALQALNLGLFNLALLLAVLTRSLLGCLQALEIFLEGSLLCDGRSFLLERHAKLALELLSLVASLLEILPHALRLAHHLLRRRRGGLELLGELGNLSLGLAGLTRSLGILRRRRICLLLVRECRRERILEVGNLRPQLGVGGIYLSLDRGDGG